ncbi:MAG: hypothetical protein HC859_06635 [Bacteroidia bacterium]|nr:hypothetical protein [Bacteroidia bacterium]
MTAADRWGNVSGLSNTVTSQTNEGPSIVIEGGADPIQLTIDAGISTTATQSITIANEAEGILRWDHFMRHSSASPSFDASSVVYPSLTKNPGP